MTSCESDEQVIHIDLDPPLRRGDTIRFHVKRI
jgi:hypothetical protein